MTLPAEQDARVRFQHGPLPADAAAVRAGVLRFVRWQVGWPELGACQDETVRITSFVAEGDGWRAHFVYVFDHDTAAQFDLTDAFRGEVLLGPDLQPLSGTFERR